MTKLNISTKSKRKKIWYSIFSFLGIGIIVTTIACPIIFTNKKQDKKDIPFVLTPIEQLTAEINNISPISSEKNPMMILNNSLLDLFTPSPLIINDENSVNYFLSNPNNVFQVKNDKLFQTLFSQMYKNSIFNIENRTNTYMGNKFTIIPILNFYSLKNSTQFLNHIKNTYNKNTKSYDITSNELYSQLDNLLMQSKTCIINFFILENNAPSTSKEFLLGNFKDTPNETASSFLNSFVIGTNTISVTSLDVLNKESIIFNETYDPENTTQKTFTQFLHGISKYFISIEYISSYDNIEKWLKQNSYSVLVTYNKISNNTFQLSIILQNKSTIIDSKKINIQYYKNNTNKNIYVPYTMN